jgi:protein O-mannosyl-transferase
MTSPAAQRKAKRQPARASRPVKQPPQDPLRWITQKPWILAVILAVFTFAIYLPVHHHPFFTMDDDGYVASNPHIRYGFTPDAIGWAFTTYDLANWHPVTWLSHMLDYQMFQLDPAGHHDMNLLLHVANAVLLFWVLLRATGYSGRSFMVAALFAFHPINVETVAWVAERKNVLSMLFFLLALGAYQADVRRSGLGRYLLVALLFAFGLMAKPQVITLPFVLLLWDYWPLRRMFAAQESSSGIAPRKLSWLVLEKLPLFALSAGSAIMTMKAQRAAGAMRYYPFSLRLENAIVAYVRYIGKAFWPGRLAVFYPHVTLLTWQVVAATLLLLAVTLLAFLRRQQRYFAVGWLWFLGTLVPMIGVVQVGEQAMADRYAYLSFVGLFLMVCWSLADWAEQLRVSRALVAATSIAVLIALAALCYRQVSYWDDNVKLWSRMLAITSGSYEVEENLGVALLESRQPEQAMQHFQRVTMLDPASHEAMGREQTGYAAVAHLYIGAYDQQHGQLSEAIEHYKKVLSLAQSFATQNVYANLPPVLIKMKAAALGNMGEAYSGLRNYSDAKDSFEAALALDPRGVRLWIGLGLAAQKLGDLAGAIEAYSRAVKLQPSDVGYLLLAQALEQTGRTGEAQAASQQAKFVSQNPAAAQRQVDGLLAH